MDPLDRLFARRPLALAAMLMALGAALAAVGRFPHALWVLAAAGAGFWLLVRPGRMGAIFAALIAGALVFSGASGMPTLPEERGAALAGDVLAVQRSSGGYETLTLGNLQIDGRAVGGRALLYLYEDANAEIGERVSAVANLFQSRPYRAPGAFDTANYQRVRGIVTCATASGLEERGAAAPSLALLQARIREGIRDRVEALYGEDAPLAQALLLGDKSGLSWDEKELFRRAGVMHLLAVSGLHMSCFALMAAWLLRRLGLGRSAAFLTTLPLLFVYVGAIGFPPSAVRALVMYAVVGGARLWGRPYDGLTALATAFLALFAREPMMVLDSGFVLSFCAIAGIVFLSEPIGRLFPDWRRRGLLSRAAGSLRSALAASLSAVLGTLPAMVNGFGGIELLAPLSAMAAIPMAVCLLPTLIVSLAAGQLVVVARGLMGALRGWVGWMAAIPPGTIRCAAWPPFAVALYALTLFLASDYWAREHRRFRAGCLAALLLFVPGANLAARLQVPRALTLTVLDAGEADAMAVTVDAKTYLVDVGDVSTPMEGFLKSGARRIAGVFLTHPHSDHAAGLSRVLDVTAVQTLYLPFCWDAVEHEPQVDEAIEKARRQGAEIRSLGAGDAVELASGVEARVLWPPRDREIADANSMSLVLWISDGQGSMLLTGDLPATSENFVVPQVGLLKAAHHGADSSNSAYLLRAANPAALAISVGHNSFGHPSPRVLTEAEAMGCQVYRTDVAGTLTFTLQRDGSMRVDLAGGGK